MKPMTRAVKAHGVENTATPQRLKISNEEALYRSARCLEMLGEKCNATAERGLMLNDQTREDLWRRLIEVIESYLTNIEAARMRRGRKWEGKV
jgi:hypothetical protein